MASQSPQSPVHIKVNPVSKNRCAHVLKGWRDGSHSALNAHIQGARNQYPDSWFQSIACVPKSGPTESAHLNWAKKEKKSPGNPSGRSAHNCSLKLGNEGLCPETSLEEMLRRHQPGQSVHSTAHQLAELHPSPRDPSAPQTLATPRIANLHSGLSMTLRGPALISHNAVKPPKIN